MTYQVATLDEIERASYRGSGLVPIRYTLGVRAFGVNAWAADEGEQLMPPHEEDSGNEELYVVVRGRATFTVAEEKVDAPSGTLVFIPSQVFRTATAEEDGTIVMAVGATVGQAFEGGNWDTFAVADDLRRAGRIDEGRAILKKTIEERPDAWGLVYNTACFEALAGNPDEAFEHLKRAVKMNPEAARPYLAEDSDLDSLRDDPRFAELAK